MPTDFTELLVGGAYVYGSPAPAAANNMRGIIDDFAVWEGVLNPSQLALLSSGMTPDLVGIDTDNDGLPDGWEMLYGFDKNNPADAGQDTDLDGLTNLQEYTKGTNPKNPDTDQDGFLDGVETGTGTFVSLTDTGTNPLNPDTDQDLLLDGVEKNTLVFVNANDTGTNPNTWDSDADGFGDGAEVALGTSPVNAGANPTLGTGSRILGYWNFNDNSAPTQAVDQVHSLLAYFTNGVVTLDERTGRDHERRGLHCGWPRPHRQTGGSRALISAPTRHSAWSGRGRLRLTCRRRRPLTPSPAYPTRSAFPSGRNGRWCPSAVPLSGRYLQALQISEGCRLIIPTGAPQGRYISTQRVVAR